MLFATTVNLLISQISETKKPSSFLFGSEGSKYKTLQTKENGFFVNFNKSNA